MNAADAQDMRETSRGRADPDESSVSNYLGRVAFYGTLIAIAASAVPNGTVEVWHKAMVISAIAAVALVRIVQGAVGGSGLRIAEPRILAPMAGVLLLAAVQMVPSPISGTTISSDPYETWVFILVFGSLIVCGEVLFAYANSVYRLNVMVGLVIATAFASALFGFLWEVLDAADYNVFALYIRPHQGYAQFINRNHFAVMVEMALGLMIGLLLKAEMSEKYRFLGWVLAGMLVYSLVAASSRGGLVSMAGLAAFAVVLHVYTKRPERHEVHHGGRRRRSRAEAFRRWRIPSSARKFIAAAGMGLLVLGLVVFIIAFVGGDHLVSRFEKVDAELTELESTKTNRNLIWHSTLDLIAAKPVLGVGFGGYEVAITEFDRSSGKSALKQAHNDYLEILANGGIVGFVLFAVFAASVLARIKRNITGPEHRERAALAFGALVGIFGVMVHNLVDFGLHVIVNALLFLVLIVIGVADMPGPDLTRTRRYIEPGIS